MKFLVQNQFIWSVDYIPESMVVAQCLLDPFEFGGREFDEQDPNKNLLITEKEKSNWSIKCQK